MRKRYPVILAIAAVAAVVGLAACGGDDDDSSDSGATAAADTATAAASGGTVSTQDVAGTGTVLVDSQGMALYTNDMDKGTTIACTEECAAEWIPLTAQGQPSSSDSAVESRLGRVKRPDGTTQVTFGGLPLYTFVEDSAGKVNGNGESDSFGGTNFTWTVASTDGAATASPTGSGSSSGDSSGGYGGGY
jgi:predicted lipoprotein with Yx(FWY)xxD motif